MKAANPYEAPRDLASGPATAEKQPWIAWLCAALMPPLGVAVGIYLNVASSRHHVVAIQAESPDELICGNAALPGLFTGFIGGALGGIIAGVVVSHLVTWLVSSRSPAQDALTNSPNPIP